MKTTTLSFALALTLILAACGNGGKTPGTNNGQPLDPQGNWLFTLTDANNISFSFAGQLFELVPPTVTGNNGMAAVGPNPPCSFSVTLNGQASGTNTINLTLSAINTMSTPPAYSLTGTIAQDQAHMSGTFTATNTEGCTPGNQGTWTASQIPAIDGTWTGTSNGQSLTAVLTENTDQTTPNMGAVTGTLAINGGTCAAPGTYNVGAAHVGERVNIPITDSNGVKEMVSLIVNPTTNNSAPGLVGYSGGSCDSRVFPVTLAKQ